VVVDQPASIGALPLTVARDAGCKVAYLPGLAMRRIADLYPGEAKTDARDAAVIADAARTMPHTLRSLELADEITAELTMLIGFDQDLAGEANRTSNRIRGLLTHFHPSLERVLGPRLDHPAITWLLERYGSPVALRKAGRRKLAEVIRPKARERGRLVRGQVCEKGEGGEGGGAGADHGGALARVPGMYGRVAQVGDPVGDAAGGGPLAERGQAVGAHRAGGGPRSGGVDDRACADPFLAAVCRRDVHGEGLLVASRVDDAVTSGAGDADDARPVADLVVEEVGQGLQGARRWLPDSSPTSRATGSRSAPPVPSRAIRSTPRPSRP
jgi:hypothetical protein